MRKRLHIVCLLTGLMVFAACAKQAAEPTLAPSPKLVAIDSLMWQRPDSALTVLMDYLSDEGRDAARHVSTNETFDNHYTHLLISELLYKNDYEQTNRRDLQKAVHYFDSLCGCTHVARNVSTDPTIAFLDARAHYINGVGYYERDSVVEACKEYLKALEIMEERFDEKELSGYKAKFMALTFTRLGVLYSDFYLHEQAIYFDELSLDYYQKYDNPTWHTAWILNNIASHYDMMGEWDGANRYYIDAINILNDTNIILYRDILSRLYFLNYERDNSQAALTLRSFETLISNSENEKEKLARCLNIGEIYYHEKQLDSAQYYLNMVFHQSTNTGAKKQAAEWLVEICKKEGKVSDILEYADFLVPFANQDENNSKLKTQLTDLYNVYYQTKLEKQHQDKARKNLYLVLLIIGILAIIIATILFLSKRKKQYLEGQIEAERHTHKIQQAALAGRLKRSNAALKELEKDAKTNLLEGSNQNKAMCFAEEPICKQIISVCNNKDHPIKSSVPVSTYVDLALSDTQKAQLKNAVMGHYGSLFKTLKQDFPTLKDKDFLYCYLCLLGLDNTQIAVLLQHSISTIWDREKRLKQIFHSDDKISIFLLGRIISDYQDVNLKTEKTEMFIS